MPEVAAAEVGADLIGGDLALGGPAAFDAVAPAVAGAAGGSAAGGGALSGVEAINAAAPGSISMGLTGSQIASDPFLSGLSGGAAGAAAGATGGSSGSASPGAAGEAGASAGPSILSAASPTMALTTDTANALGIGGAFDAAGTGTGVDAGTFSSDAGLSSVGVPASPGFDSSIWTGGAPTDVPTPLPDQTITPEDNGIDPTKTPGAMGQIKKTLNDLGLSPATAAMLGISGAQALSTPKLPAAANTLSNIAGPGATAASATIQSGGTSSPAWATQKASIDATIDQQIQQQTEAMVQQAVNSGQGADSQVVQQQVNKLKNDLETQRQTLYAQAQQQNVTAALSELGISDQALSSIASTQFSQDNQAKSAAASTAQNALILQALSKQQPAAANT